MGGRRKRSGRRPAFTSATLALGLCENDFYGIYEKVWIGTGLKKVP
jgi:hypothetical protein